MLTLRIIQIIRLQLLSKRNALTAAINGRIADPRCADLDRQSWRLWTAMESLNKDLLARDERARLAKVPTVRPGDPQGAVAAA
jgi:hypothetical protein